MSRELFLDALDVARDLTIGLDLADDFGVIVSAPGLSFASARGVSVVRVQHSTVLFLEFPVFVHPAAVATPIIEVLVEQLFVIIIFTEGAVDEVLLGEAHGGGSVFLGDVALKSRVRGKSVARSAVTLIFDGVHVATRVVINGSGVHDAHSAAADASVIELGALGLILFLETEVR